jgi:predicted aldo/keto reductase-like oxidoreductase
LEQLKENIEIMSSAKANTLTEKEKGIIEKVSRGYNELIEYSCTGCRYCLPCQVKLDIPAIIDLYNQWDLFAGNEKIKKDYDMWFGKERIASSCVECGQCEEKCPQSLPIIEIMKKAAKRFD